MTTRHNLSPNPACGTDTTGWIAQGSLARTTSITGMPVTTGIAVTGNGFVKTPTAVAAPGDVFTVSFYIKNNSGSTISPGKQVFISYTRSAGGDTFPESFNTASIGVDGNVQRASFTTAAAPADTTGIYLTIDQLVVGIEVSATLPEKVGTLDSYFDGNTAGATWDGTTNNSTSTLPDPSVTPSSLSISITLGSPTVTTISDASPTSLTISITFGDPTITTSSPASPSTSSGGWRQLLSIYAEQRQFELEDRDQEPLSCPNDGEPLQRDPNGRLRCSFDGWIWDGAR